MQTSYIVLSTGNALVVSGTATTFVSFSAGGGTGTSNRGNRAFDVARLSLTLTVPSGATTLSFNWKFGTEENPTFTTSFRDYFRATVAIMQGQTNIARLPDNNAVDVFTADTFSNDVTGSSFLPTGQLPSPNDVVYNAVTPTYTASFNVASLGGRQINISFEVGDENDTVFDSAAFIDNLGFDVLRIVCPADIIAECNTSVINFNIVLGSSGFGDVMLPSITVGAIVNYSPPTTSGGVGRVTVTCTPPSGSVFPHIPPGPTTHIVKCVARDEAGNTASCDFKVTVKDTTPPVITLNGANPLILECPEQYEEPRAMVRDICDPNPLISGTIQTLLISGTVDSHRPGDYTITYTATDKSGNQSSETRTVKVVDTKPPVITLNGANPLILECPEPYMEPGATVKDECDPNPTLTSSETVLSSRPGDYTITYTAKDAHGNTSSTTRTVKVTAKGALYVWRERVLIDRGEAQRLADFAVTKGIKTIYYDILGSGQQSDADLSYIISLLHRHGLKVEALYSRTWLTSFTDNASLLSSTVNDKYRRIQDVIDYNMAVSADARFDGIRLDIEANSFPSKTFFGGGKEPTEDVDIKLYDDAVSRAGDLPVYVSIGHNWNKLITYNNVEKAAYKHILDIVAGVDVQTATHNPVDDPRTEEREGIGSRTEDEVFYAHSLALGKPKPVHITIETNDVVTDSCMCHRNTFFEEGESVMESTLANLSFFGQCGFAYHFYKHSYGSPNWVRTDPVDPVDKDCDGIFNTVDVEPDRRSKEFEYGTIKGTITNWDVEKVKNEKQVFQIIDVDALDPIRYGAIRGVRIHVCRGETIILSIDCGEDTVFLNGISQASSEISFPLSAGNEIIVTCGSSVTISVIRGTVEVTFIPDAGPPATTSLKENNSLTFDPTTFTLTAPATNPDTVIVSVQGFVGGETTPTQGTISLSGGNRVIFNPTTFTVTAPATNLTPLSVSIDGKSFTLDPGSGFDWLYAR